MQLQYLNDKQIEAPTLGPEGEHPNDETQSHHSRSPSMTNRDSCVRLIACICGMLSGCVSLVPIAPTEKVGMTPPLGDARSATVGDVILSQYRSLVVPGAVLEADVNVSLGFGRVSSRAGDTLIAAALNGRNVFCTAKHAYIDPVVGPHRLACFIDANHSGTFSIAAAAPEGSAWFQSAILPPGPYSLIDQPVPGTGSYKSQLVYQGLGERSVRLAYREFIDDMARPVSSQDFTYDLESGPTVIRFRASTIEILDARDNRITYRVLSGF